LRNYHLMKPPTKPKICHECGTGFPAAGHNARYCSNACRRVVRKRWVASLSLQVRKKWNRVSKTSTEKRVDRRWAEIFKMHGASCSKSRVAYPRCVYDLHHPKG